MKKLLALALWLLTSIASAALTDTGNHPPPTSGTQNYNGAPFSDLPAVGGTYVDSVFGETVRRLTNIGNTANLEFNYAFSYINADSTKVFTHQSDLSVLNITTGAVLYSGQPEGTINDDTGAAKGGLSDIRWDVLDADKYYFPNGASLMVRNLAAQTTTTLKTFPASLQQQGGSVANQSADGCLFVVKYSNTHHVYDKCNDLIYAGNIPPASSTGYAGITPSGNYVYTGGGAGSSNGLVFLSFAINKVAHTVNTTGVNFWNLCGDHGVAVSASNGTDYVVTFDCNGSTNQIYAASVATNRAAMTPAQQRSSSVLLLDLNNSLDGGHFTSVSRGALQNWVVAEIESGDDTFNQAVGAWRPYKGELIAFDVVNGTKRRLIHHRSRNRTTGNMDYESQPKPSLSPTGDVLVFDSNMNDSTPVSFADLFALLNPLGAAGGTTPSLTSQTVTLITNNGGKPGVTTDGTDGTLYMVIVPDGDTPSATQIKAGQQSSGSAALKAENIPVSSAGAKTFTTVTGLAQRTDYDVWFLHRSAAGNDSIAVKADFTTKVPLPIVLH